MSKQQKPEFTQEDKDFLGVERQSDRETLKHGFLRNLDYPVKQQYENIYKRVIDPNFVLCFHCSNDVKDMVTKVQDLYLKDSEQVQTNTPTLIDFVVTEEYLREHPELTEAKVGDTIQIEAPAEPALPKKKNK